MTPNHIPALLIIAAFVAAWPAGAATADDHFGPAAERGALFEEFVETIRKHSYINKSGLKKLGTEWQAELNKSKRRFLNAKTSQQAYYAIVSLKNSTHDFHSLLGSGPPPDDTKDLERYVRYVPNLFDVKLLERRIEGLQIVPAYRKKSTEVEFVVSEGVAGVPPGSVLVSIDGIQGIEDFEGYDDRAVPVSELRKHYYQWFSRGSSRYALDQGFATWLTARHSKLNPVPTDGDVHTYRFRSGGQKEIELKAKWLDFNPDKSSGWHPICTPCKEVKEYQDPDRFKLVFRRLNYCIYRPLNVRENVAIVHMFTFDYPDGNEPLKNCCEKKKHDLPKNPIIGWRETDHRALVQSLAHVVGADGVVIFDLRRTGGGTFDPELIGKFTPMPYKIHTKSFYYSDNFPDPTAEKKWKILRSPDANLFIGQYPESRPMSLSLPAAVRYIQDSKRRAGQALFSPPIPFFCKVNCSSGEADYQGVGDPHRRVVAILGPPCSSACDQFASLLVDNGIARSYGMPTAGASSPYRLWVQLPLKSKALVKIQLTIGVDYRPNTRRLTLDGNPVEPDVLVLPRSGDDGGPPGNYLDLTLNEIYQDLSLNAK